MHQLLCYFNCEKPLQIIIIDADILPWAHCRAQPSVGCADVIVSLFMSLSFSLCHCNSKLNINAKQIKQRDNGKWPEDLITDQMTAQGLVWLMTLANGLSDWPQVQHGNIAFGHLTKHLFVQITADPSLSPWWDRQLSLCCGKFSEIVHVHKADFCWWNISRIQSRFIK